MKISCENCIHLNYNQQNLVAISSAYLTTAIYNLVGLTIKPLNLCCRQTTRLIGEPFWKFCFTAFHLIVFLRVTDEFSFAAAGVLILTCTELFISTRVYRTIVVCSVDFGIGRRRYRWVRVCFSFRRFNKGSFFNCSIKNCIGKFVLIENENENG